jgi:hypothetical protein
MRHLKSKRKKFTAKGKFVAGVFPVRDNSIHEPGRGRISEHDQACEHEECKSVNTGKEGEGDYFISLTPKGRMIAEMLAKASKS